MVIIEPSPRGYATIVVMHDPLHAFDVAICQGIHLLWVIIRYFEFSLGTIYQSNEALHPLFKIYLVVSAFPLIHLVSDRLFIPRIEVSLLVVIRHLCFLVLC
jgi:hypothetical protein